MKNGHFYGDLWWDVKRCSGVWSLGWEGYLCLFGLMGLNIGRMKLGFLTEHVWGMKYGRNHILTLLWEIIQLAACHCIEIFYDDILVPTRIYLEFNIFETL